jgi:predicted transcriptional regulator
MTDRSESKLSGLQLAVMRAVWERGEATVADVHGALESERSLAPTTVATLLKRLEARGLLTHRNVGRQYIYRALVDADDVGRALVGELARDLYGGKGADLFAHLLDATEVSGDDLARIRQMLEEREGR